MKAPRYAILLALAVALTGCDFLAHGPRGAVAAAEKRVNAVLAGMHTSGTTTDMNLQEAVCRWYNGKRFINDAMEMEAALDGFDRWRRERKMFNVDIPAYEIVESEVVADSDPTMVIVTVTIGGKTHQIKVPDSRAMSWHGKPPR